MRRTNGPAVRFTHRGEGMAMKGRGSVLAEGVQVIGGGVTFMASQAVLRIDGVPLGHTRIAVRLGEDGSGGDGNAASISVDDGFLLDEHVEFDGVEEQIVRDNGKLAQSGGHGLAAGLINIPGVNALRIDFRDGPGESMFANARSEFVTAVGDKFFGVVEADDAPLGVQDNGCSDDGAKQRATTSFIEASDARPSQLASSTFKMRATTASHKESAILACGLPGGDESSGAKLVRVLPFF